VCVCVSLGKLDLCRIYSKDRDVFARSAAAVNHRRINWMVWRTDLVAENPPGSVLTLQAHNSRAIQPTTRTLCNWNSGASNSQVSTPTWHSNGAQTRINTLCMQNCGTLALGWIRQLALYNQDYRAALGIIFVHCIRGCGCVTNASAFRLCTDVQICTSTDSE